MFVLKICALMFMSTCQGQTERLFPTLSDCNSALVVEIQKNPHGTAYCQPLKLTRN